MDIVQLVCKIPFVNDRINRKTTSDHVSKVLVLGPGGVGKTTLGAFLNGQKRSILEKPNEYITTVDFEDFDIDGIDGASLHIAPGQARSLEHNWKSICRGLEDGEFAGVILVSSYGYHAIGNIDYKGNPAYEKGNSDTQFMKKYLVQRQQLEISLLDSVCKAIASSNQRIWLLNFVSKQDLWMRNSSDVEKYYTSGDYHQVIDTLLRTKNSENFRYDTTFGCVEIANFVTGRGVELAKCSAGYGQSQQADSLNHLLGTIKTLIRWTHGEK